MIGQEPKNERERRAEDQDAGSRQTRRRAFISDR